MLADVAELVAGALIVAIGAAIATVFLARRWALRISAATWREERAKRRKP